jgi:AcrR family transcriptional regulator
MKQSRVDVGTIRREQIVDAAVAVIAEQGIQELSLSEIEKRAHMSRGQLTYYFKTKEDILLAVFDRLLHMMRERAASGQGPVGACLHQLSGWERLRHFLTILVLHPPVAPEFHALQYTFLSQTAHRPDFRERLAKLYEEWRSHLAGDAAQELAGLTEASFGVSPRTVASLVQAILHGLAVQRAADPNSFDREEMLALVLHLLGGLLRPEQPAPNGQPEPRPAPVRRARRRRLPRGVTHEDAD